MKREETSLTDEEIQELMEWVNDMGIEGMWRLKEAYDEYQASISNQYEHEGIIHVVH